MKNYLLLDTLLRNDWSQLATNLDQMVEHELCYAHSSPFWVSEYERHICINVGDIWDQKCKPYDNFLVDGNTAEVRELEALRYCKKSIINMLLCCLLAFFCQI